MHVHFIMTSNCLLSHDHHMLLPLGHCLRTGVCNVATFFLLYTVVTTQHGAPTTWHGAPTTWHGAPTTWHGAPTTWH